MYYSGGGGGAGYEKREEPAASGNDQLWAGSAAVQINETKAEVLIGQCPAFPLMGVRFFS